MKKIGITLMAILFGLAVGVGSALKASGMVGNPPLEKLANINVSHWLSDWSIGAPTANAYLRARVAKRGLLALSKSEAVYFTRRLDDDGNLLNASCRYKLSGQGQDARWWSITLYDNHNRLPMNEDGALSIDATQMENQTGDNPNWSAVIAPTSPQTDFQTVHWISSRHAGDFDLTLRLYLPSKALLDDPQAILNPPHIEKLDCKTGEIL